MAIQDFRTEQEKRGLGGIAQSALSGFMQGIQLSQNSEKSNQQAELKKLDYAIKLIEMQDKIRESQAKKTEMEFVQNELKAQGIIPRTPEEEAALRGNLFAGVGGVDSKPKIKTESSILRGIEDARKGGYDYSAQIDYGGVKHRFETPGKKSGGLTDYQKAQIEQKKREEILKDIDQTLSSLASNEVLKKLQEDQNNSPNPALYQKPTSEEIKLMVQSVKDKYREPVTKYKLGKMKDMEYRKIIEDLRNKGNESEKLDFSPFLGGN